MVENIKEDIKEEFNHVDEIYVEKVINNSIIILSLSNIN
jgi:hypothetical protein